MTLRLITRRTYELPDGSVYEIEVSTDAEGEVEDPFVWEDGVLVVAEAADQRTADVASEVRARGYVEDRLRAREQARERGREGGKMGGRPAGSGKLKDKDLQRLADLQAGPRAAAVLDLAAKHDMLQGSVRKALKKFLSRRAQQKP